MGELREGKPYGLGRAALADGVKYVGEFRDGKAHGIGRLMYANGDEYIGEFKDDKKHGHGALYYLANNQFKGDKYVGEFKDGKRHGKGTYISINGGREIREYKNGLPDGRVIGYLADGNIEYSNIYQNGNLIKSEDVEPDIFMRAAKWLVGLRSSTESVDDNRAVRPH